MIPTYDVVFYGFLAVLLVPVLAVLVGLLWWFRLHRELAHVGRRMGARWWDGAAPVTLATGIITLAVLLGDVPDEGESGYLAFIFSAALLIVGVAGATLALGNLDEYRQTTAGADSAGTVEDGPTVVAGTATANDEVLTGPLSGEPSLYHTLRITERRGFGHRKASAEIHYEREGVPFTVDDGTGNVVVNPTDGVVRLWQGDQISADAVASSDADDGSIAAAVERARERVGLDASDDRTFAEMRLAPSTDVTVLGTVDRDPEARYPVVRDGDRRLAVIEGTLDEVRDSLRQRVRGGAALGVGGLVVGTAGVFFTAGVV